MEISHRVGKSFWFDLPAANTDDARSFYEGLFRWEFLRLKGDVLSDYWVIQAGSELIGGLRKTAFEGRPHMGPVIYITVENLAASSQRIKDLGGELVGNHVDLGEGRGVYQWFRDREGNVLSIWAPNPSKEDRT